MKYVNFPFADVDQHSIHSVYVGQKSTDDLGRTQIPVNTRSQQ